MARWSLAQEGTVSVGTRRLRRWRLGHGYSDDGGLVAIEALGQSMAVIWWPLTVIEKENEIRVGIPHVFY